MHGIVQWCFAWYFFTASITMRRVNKKFKEGGVVSTKQRLKKPATDIFKCPLRLKSIAPFLGQER